MTRQPKRDLASMIWALIPAGESMARNEIAKSVCTYKSGGLGECLAWMVRAGMLVREEVKRTGRHGPSIFFHRPTDAVFVKRPKRKPNPNCIENLRRGQIPARTPVYARIRPPASVWDYASRV